MDKRLETILSLELPYGETLAIRRSVYRGGKGPRVAVTAGIHGDELEGLYLCHRLAAWLEQLGREQPAALLGQVELYPGLNPLGLDTLQRTLPLYDIDLNRSFPGHPEGLLPQRIAAAVLERLSGAALVLDVHASTLFLRELPQARINRRFAERLLPLARQINVNVIWVRATTAMLETTLVHQLNTQGTQALLVEMGAGLGLTSGYAEQVMTGILNVWKSLGVLAPKLTLPEPEHRPLLIEDAGVQCLNAEASGLFVAAATQTGPARVEAGELLGRIVSPFEGRTLAEVRAPRGGLLLTLRHYPLVYEGSLLARIVEPRPETGL